MQPIKTLKIMRPFYLLLMLIAVSCGGTNKGLGDFDGLSTQQIKNTGPKEGLPGKCYTKMKDASGNMDWYQMICSKEEKHYEVASNCLKKMGYIMLEGEQFETAQGNALIDFQKKNNLAYGALDEATLYLLIQKSKKR